MSRNDCDEQDQWEREHDHCLIWKCPKCGYTYESPRDMNEAMPCEDCDGPTVLSGESYT